MAEKKGLKYIAITDHESVNGHFQLREINVKDYYSGKIIPGAELKNYYKDRVIDILAYNIDVDKFNEYLVENYKDKTHRILETKNLKQKLFLMIQNLHLRNQKKKYLNFTLIRFI